MITVKVNQEEHQIQQNTTLSVLINALRIPSNGIAVAVNQHIIKKDDWNGTSLQKDDDILIIKATQGG